MLDIRKTDIVSVYRLYLMVDPSKRYARGGLRGSLYATIDAIEALGGTIVELSTGRRSSDRQQRDAMIRDAIEDMARSRSDAPVGRPRKDWTDSQKAIIQKHWFLLAHPTNQAAVRAMKSEGVVCSTMQAHRLLGKSGRIAGNPLHRKTTVAASGNAAAACVVYFVRRGGRGPIKIGKAIDVEKRVASLQSGNAERLVLLGTAAGGAKMEREMHKRFAEYRLGGEWFRYAGKLAAFVKTLKGNYILDGTNWMM